jgi:hypothetical protein
MSESVKILIEAENKASAVIETTAKDIENKVKSIKASGEQAKKSTEFFGSIANALGGSEIGAFAGQLSQLTEKTSQFAEVQKLGGAGALAFKAGLVAAVGVIGFQFGQAIGNSIFQTQKWVDELERARKKADELASSLIELKNFNIGRDKEQISLIRDPEEQKRATKALLDQIDDEVAKKRESINRLIAQKDDKEKPNEYSGLELITPALAVKKKLSSYFGSDEQLKQAIVDGEAFIKNLSDRATEIRRENDETAQKIKLQREEKALQDKSDDFLKGLREEVELLRVSKEEQASILALRSAVGEEAQAEAKALLLEKQAIAAKEEAARAQEAANQRAISEQEAITKGSENYVKSLREQLALLKATDAEKAATQAGQKAVGADVSVATGLLAEIESIRAVAEFQKMMDGELLKIQAEKETAAQRLIDLKQGELDKLEAERIALTRGEEAAAAFRLMKQGLAEDDAKEIARQQAEIAKLKEDQKPGKVVKDGASPLQANESRLLTRGEGDDPTKQVAINTANSLRELQLLNKRLLDSQLKTLNVKVVGGKP